MNFVEAILWHCRASQRTMRCVTSLLARYTRVRPVRCVSVLHICHRLQDLHIRRSKYTDCLRPGDNLIVAALEHNVA